MIKKSINNKKYFEIYDDSSNLYYGCKQDWYTKTRQKLMGCGPTVASNIIIYFDHKLHDCKSDEKYDSKKNCLLLMEEAWKYVTPTLKGVDSTKIFYEGMLDFAKSKGFIIQYKFLDIPKEKLSRPQFTQVLNFIAESLQMDCPVAFLNLSNGEEKYLDQWHWVTIVSLEYEEDGMYASADILDEGIIKKINLLLWYNTTKLGGGLVCVINLKKC